MSPSAMNCRRRTGLRSAAPAQSLVREQSTHTDAESRTKSDDIDESTSSADRRGRGGARVCVVELVRHSRERSYCQFSDAAISDAKTRASEASGCAHSVGRRIESNG